jgi:hypothetical protein
MRFLTNLTNPTIIHGTAVLYVFIEVAYGRDHHVEPPDSREI